MRGREQPGVELRRRGADPELTGLTTKPFGSRPPERALIADRSPRALWASSLALGPGNAGEGGGLSLSSALTTDPANWEKGSRKRERRKCKPATPPSCRSLEPEGGVEKPAELALTSRLKTGLACAGLVDTKGDQKA